MVSWYKHRHPEMLDSCKGELNSIAAVEQYARFWNRVVDDAQDQIVVRYEFAAQDSKTLGMKDVRRVFKGFRSAKRNNGVLSPPMEDYLHELVEVAYKDLYQEWAT